MNTRSGLWLAAMLLTGCGPAGDSVTLQGSGATFPAPLYQRWFLELYRTNPDLRVNYQAVGSGAGVRQFSDGLTVIGATDAPLKDDELKAASDKLGVGVLQVPMTAGAVALCYNVPGVDRDKPLRLSRDVLLKLLLKSVLEDDGKKRTVVRWDDPLIRKLNPGVKLPELPITWVRRSEGSGTTYAFTSHLAAVSPEWKKVVGANKSVTWRLGVGAKGNDGVAALIEQTPGAFGYVEYGFAQLANLPCIALENKKGKFVAPGRESNAAALRGVKVPADFRVAVPDPEGEDAYPIVTYTWMVVRAEYDHPGTAHAVREVLTYCATEGQKLSDELGYIPLPDDVTRRVKEAIGRIKP